MATTEKKKTIAQNEDSKSEGQDQKGVYLFQYINALFKKSFNIVLLKKKKKTYFR